MRELALDSSNRFVRGGGNRYRWRSSSNRWRINCFWNGGRQCNGIARRDVEDES